ncbi:hypothetical protein V502_08261 [Pseudogymnoascus sp. VKM F-4520 (FW-2644)]|nr:hypothetical protein V502_08261 [Pseudogymnoascus sp. VKM F-4520 (FW-2644)]
MASVTIWRAASTSFENAFWADTKGASVSYQRHRRRGNIIHPLSGPGTAATTAPQRHSDPQRLPDLLGRNRQVHTIAYAAGL